MKKGILITALFLTVFFTVSCSSDDNNSVAEQTQSKFKGSWTGTYDGETAGSWTAEINETGQIEGVVAQSGLQVLFQLKGSVGDSGALDANFYYNDQVVGEFKGSLSTNSGQGTWSNTILNISGTWEGTKN